jgi:tRNA-splicing ligase RtcB
MEEPLWGELSILRQLKDRAQAQLGSSGGGNHFADLVLVDFVEPMAPFDAGDTAVGLLTHSGSRGTGYQVATRYVQVAEQETRAMARDIPKGYEWLRLESEAGQEYLAAMALMGRYAKANHDLIHEHFIRAAGAKAAASVWNRHNYAWIDEATGEVLHRKGATPAETGQLGLIPGTSGSASYLVRGLGNEESLHSSSHGAGRYFSRREAFRRHDARAFQRQMAEQDVLHFGVSPDEAPGAYKDIEMVLDLQRGVLVEPVARMRPKVVFMGGRADDGD